AALLLPEEEWQSRRVLSGLTRWWERQCFSCLSFYYGDNLKILSDYIKDESVDLIYLDPPFNSNRNYNVLFKDESGTEADSQRHAFEDTWHWHQPAEEPYRELVAEGRFALIFYHGYAVGL